MFSSNPIKTVQTEIRELFLSVHEGDVHGYAHAINVYHHAKMALQEVAYQKKLHTEQRMAILYAALLHDCDDHKIFPHSKNHFNTRRILASIHFSAIDLVTEMIDLVSFSKNGNRGAVPTLEDHQRPSWMYIPRDADRVEALGTMGVVRCLAYEIQIHRPMFDENTPRPTTKNQLYRISARMFTTGFAAKTTLDYFIAALIPRHVMASQTCYFSTLSTMRMQPIEDFCLLYGAQGFISTEDLLRIVSAMDERQILVESGLL